MNNGYQVTKDVPAIQKIVDGEIVWQLTGEQVDELLDDFSRMENLLTDLVQPEVAAQGVRAEMVTCLVCDGSGLLQTYKPNVFMCCPNCVGSGTVPESAADRKEKIMFKNNSDKQDHQDRMERFGRLVEQPRRVVDYETKVKPILNEEQKKESKKQQDE